jgi:hypothetical protein
MLGVRRQWDGSDASVAKKAGWVFLRESFEEETLSSLGMCTSTDRDPRMPQSPSTDHNLRTFRAAFLLQLLVSALF